MNRALFVAHQYMSEAVGVGVHLVIYLKNLSARVSKYGIDSLGKQTFQEYLRACHYLVHTNLFFLNIVIIKQPYGTLVRAAYHSGICPETA